MDLFDLGAYMTIFRAREGAEGARARARARGAVVGVNLEEDGAGDEGVGAAGYPDGAVGVGGDVDAAAAA